MPTKSRSVKAKHNKVKASTPCWSVYSQPGSTATLRYGDRYVGIVFYGEIGHKDHSALLNEMVAALNASFDDCKAQPVAKSRDFMIG